MRPRYSKSLLAPPKAPDSLESGDRDGAGTAIVVGTGRASVAFMSSTWLSAESHLSQRGDAERGAELQEDEGRWEDVGTRG